MKTLIELYDERPIENVLSPEVFRPERTVYLCPGEVVQGKVFQKTVQNFFRHRGVNTETVFLESSLYNTAKLKRQLLSVLEQYDDCCLDITGGTDAALFAQRQRHLLQLPARPCPGDHPGHSGSGL